MPTATRCGLPRSLNKHDVQMHDKALGNVLKQETVSLEELVSAHDAEEGVELGKVGE